MNHFPFNEPLFWEILGGLIVLSLLVFFAYWGCLIFYVVSSGLIEEYQDRKRPVLIVNDPVFGEIRFNARDESWEGIAFFKPDSSCDMIYIEAGEFGPTEVQRALYHQIEQRYTALLPMIEQALHEYIEEYQECIEEYVEEKEEAIELKASTFDLFSLEIPAANELQTWSVRFFSPIDVNAEMRCEVIIANWKVSEVRGI